jgi:hypothetical protein
MAGAQDTITGPDLGGFPTRARRPSERIRPIAAVWRGSCVLSPAHGSRRPELGHAQCAVPLGGSSEPVGPLAGSPPTSLMLRAPRCLREPEGPTWLRRPGGRQRPRKWVGDDRGRQLHAGGEPVARSRHHQRCQVHHRPAASKAMCRCVSRSSACSSNAGRRGHNSASCSRAARRSFQ